MKRWLWLPVAVVMAFSACDDKDGKSAPVRAQNGSAAKSPPSAARLPDTDAVDRLQNKALGYANTSDAPTDEAASGSGDRFFDGKALTNAGFTLPGATPVVYASGNQSAKARAAARLTTPNAPRRRGDLTAEEPPSPDLAQFPPSSEALAAGAGKVLAAFDGFEKKMYDAAAPIMSRAGWRAAPRKGRAVAMTPTHVTVHHTEGAQTMTADATAAEVKGIQHYHMAGRAREGKDVWEDIGYHFLIDGAGRVVEGRPAETLGAHAGGANGNNIGIAMMGNFMKVKPTAEQVESLTRLVSFLAVKYRQDPSRAGFLEGHKHYNNTDCPGTNMMSILAALRLRIDAQTQQLESRLRESPKGEFVPVVVDA